MDSAGYLKIDPKGTGENTEDIRRRFKATKVAKGTLELDLDDSVEKQSGFSMKSCSNIFV